jgi:heat shock protein HslJ
LPIDVERFMLAAAPMAEASAARRRDQEASLMTRTLARVTCLAIATASVSPPISRAQEKAGSWLDQPKPASWKIPGADIPAAPREQEAVDSRCRKQARPPEWEEDKRLRDQGWDLVGGYEGGWQMVVIGDTAGYDGMCRPRRYQEFVFVGGAFAGTLSPQPMDSRTDGALARVSLQEGRLTAEYVRYGASDALCCPSRESTVVFAVPSGERPVVRPVSSSTRASGVASGAASSRPLDGTKWTATELAGKAVRAPSSENGADLEFGAQGRVSGSDGCNRIMGTFELKGDRLTFGQMAGTRKACLDPAGTERPFRDALKNASRFTIAGDRLELFDTAGTRVAAFTGNAQTAGRAPASGLAGTSWQLVKFQGGDDTTLTPDDRAKYTIEFAPDGQLVARIDCNRGRGTWKSSGASELRLGPLALTRAQCPPGSLHDQIARQWEHIRSYVIKDTHLFLSLMADGGIYEFEPISTTK